LSLRLHFLSKSTSSLELLLLVLELLLVLVLLLVLELLLELLLELRWQHVSWNLTAARSCGQEQSMIGMNPHFIRE
jgi:hypothetical protein